MTQPYGRLFGTLVKFNRKTLTVLTEADQQWKVSLHLLTEIKDATPKQRTIYGSGWNSKRAGNRLR